MFFFYFSKDPQEIREAKLLKQQLESEGDSKWLQQEENTLVSIYWYLIFILRLCQSLSIPQKNRLSFITTGSNMAEISNVAHPLNGLSTGLSDSFHSQLLSTQGQSTSFDTQPQSNPSLSSSRPHTPIASCSSLQTNPFPPSTSQPQSNANDHHNHKHIPNPKPQLTLDRTNDSVYFATTSVVKAIMTLSQGVERAVAADYLDLVKNVGFELRALLASVDKLSTVFPAQAHK